MDSIAIVDMTFYVTHEESPDKKSRMGWDLLDELNNLDISIRGIMHIHIVVD